MKSLSAAALVVVALVSGVHAQTSGGTFEVASIKPSRPDAPRGGFGLMPGGRFQAEAVTLGELITAAYGKTLPLYRFQVTGGPDWIDRDRFDILAKWNGAVVPGTNGPPPEQMFGMIRALLDDRFKLVAREETRDAPIYALTLAKSDGTLGPKLRRSSIVCPEPGIRPPAGPPPSECIYTVGYGVLKGRGVAISRLALSLANFYGIGRLVADRTGLTGSFDMDMEWAPLVQFRQPGNLDPPADAADRPVNAGSTIFVALQEQLGLRLDSQRGPVPLVVIERAERPTSD